MSYKNICKLCDKLIISTAVTFTEDTGLVITIPEGSYNNCEKYCIVVAQSLPAETTIIAPVFIQIGDGEELYPLNKCNCAQITACGIRTRTKYCTKVVTTPTGGSFQIIGKTCCEPDNNLRSINGDAPTE